MDSEQRPCLSCGAPFMAVWTVLAGRRRYHSFHCETCLDRLQLAQEQAAAAIHARQMASRSARWKDIVLAPCYMETDITHPDLAPEILRGALAWRPGARGLGLVGESRKGKTRSLHLALRTAWDAGRNCLAVREVDFARCAEAASYGTKPEQRQARELLWNWQHVATLLFDDIGKASASAPVSEALYSLLDYRATHRLPVLWSAQAGSAWIRDKYGPDHGLAIAARLGKEFCDLHVIPSPS